MNEMKTAIMCRGLLRLINGFHRISSPSSRQRFLVRHILLGRRTVDKLTYVSEFYSTNVVTTSLREEQEKESLHEISNNTTILDLLEQVSESDDFTYITFHPVMRDCVRVLPSMRKEEYIRLANIILPLKEKFRDLYGCDENMIHISEYLDSVLCDCLSQEERPEEVLNILRISKVLIGRPSFTIDVIQRVKTILKWPTPLMLQYLQHMNQNSLWNIYHVDKHGVQYALVRHFPYLNIDQSAILLRALNHLKGEITEPDLPRKVLELFLEQHSSAKQSTIAVFLRFFSRLVPCFWVRDFNIHSFLPDIFRVVNQNVDSWPLENVVHFASFCRSSVCYDDVFFKKLTRRMLSDDALHLNAKFIDELVVAVVYFNGSGRYTEELTHFLQLMKVEPMNSCLRAHPKRLVNIVNNLSKVGVYDHYLLEVIFSKGFLLDTYKKLNAYFVSENVYSLDENVQAECVHYDGRQLDKKLRELFRRRRYNKLSESPDDSLYFKYFKQICPYQRLANEMRPILQEMLGEKCVHLCQMHLHVPKPNFIFAMKDGVPIELDEKIRECHYLPVTELNRQYDWYTFKFLTPNTLPPHEPLLLYNGINSARLLTNVGVNLIPLVANDWRSMAKDEQIAHLRKLIFVKS